MGWEYRGNRLYYYRKKREGQHVVSEYIGAGATAHLIAMLDDDDHLERVSSTTKWKKQREEQRKIDNSMEDVQKQISSFVRAVLLTSGYHAHKGQWREVRHG